MHKIQINEVIWMKVSSHSYMLSIFDGLVWFGLVWFGFMAYQPL